MVGQRKSWIRERERHKRETWLGLTFESVATGKAKNPSERSAWGKSENAALNISLGNGRHNFQVLVNCLKP